MAQRVRKGSPKAKRAAKKKSGSKEGRRGLPDARLLVRIKFSPDIYLGPGKVELLERIGQTGSISAAAREMEMSYRRAWLLVDELARMFKREVVTRATGGQNGGGAVLTDFGRALIGAFRRIEARTRAAVNEELAPFEGDLLT